MTQPQVKRGGAAGQAGGAPRARSPARAAHEVSDTATTVQMRRDRPVDERWRELGIDPSSAQTDRSGTIVPPSTQRSMAPEAPEPALPSLPALWVTDADEPRAEFRLGPVLGSGGMGVVQTATQTTLGREVAIKTLHANAKLEADGPALLLEARVTGTLDHPNVVPVHSIGRDRSERPLIVMKRIEGMSWDALIAELGHQPDGAFDQALTRHLTILVQVARAVHFAHSKGILHRDLKPSNVMIGEFGEVYLVDWGIAVALDHRAPKGLPYARECTGLAGTAAYMAPEMAACVGEMLSERTDVYLLGAILHELITGFAPHESPTMLDSLRRAFESKPYDYGADVPAALAAICTRAMAWNPENRFPDAGSFAEAVEQFLHHRGSTSLSDEARKLLDGLAARAATVDPDDEPAVRTLRATFSEARFAFHHALKVWPGNGEAREGLQQALELLIEFELRSQAPDAAALLVDELPNPRPALAERVSRAVREQRAIGDRLRRLERETDTRVGDRLRAVVLVAGSLLWSAICIGTGLLRRHAGLTIDASDFAWVCVGFGAALAMTAVVARRWLYATAATKRIAQTTLVIFVAYSFLWPLGAHFDIPLEAISAMTLVTGSVLWTTLAFQGQRRWLGMASGMVLALLALLRWPAYNFEWMGVGSLLGGLFASSLRLRTLWLGRHGGSASDGRSPTR